MSVTRFGVLCLLAMAMFVGMANAQCSGKPETMSCNVPYWCNLRVGGFPVFNLATNDCICWQLCQDARSQGEGSSCYFQDDAATGGRWYQITFNKWNADNNYRGTVLCDPRGKPGRKMI